MDETGSLESLKEGINKKVITKGIGFISKRTSYTTIRANK